jgi:tubulin beta
MGREVIQIQVGQCGNHVGTKFWEVISAEHGVGPAGWYQGDSEVQLDQIDAYYCEGVNGNYVSRAVLVDLDARPLDSVRGSQYGRLFRPENIVYGTGGSGNNWAAGFYSAGHELLGITMDRIRREAESCDCLQGFQFVHSVCGGTGSGLGSLLLDTIREQYPARIMSTYTLWPSPQRPDIVVAPYNCTLAFDHLINTGTHVFCFDNQKLHEMSMKKQGIDKPTYGHLNSLVAMVMAGATCSLRFPGQRNADLRKLAVNLIPFPRLPFLTCGFGPLSSRARQPYFAQTVQELTSELFHQDSIMTSFPMHAGLYLTAALQFRGQISPMELDEQIVAAHARKIRLIPDATAYVHWIPLDKMRSGFVVWIPSNITSSICHIPPPGLKMSATLVANHTGIRALFHQIEQQFNLLYARRSFLAQYINEGLETVALDEARGTLSDYQDHLETYQMARAQEEEDEEDYSDDDL